MPNDEMENDLRARWQSQPAEGGKMSLEEVRASAERFRQRFRKRNIREYSAAVITFAIVLGEIWFLGPVLPIRWGLILCLAGGPVMLYQLHKRASARVLPADLALTSCLEFHRGELERQRDGHQNVLYWYILPFVPGLLVLIISLLFMPGGRGWFPALTVTVLMTLTFILIVKLNKRVARQLQRDIDQLRG